MATPSSVILIEGALVYDHDGDTDQPPRADVLIANGRIAAVEPGIGERIRSGAGHPVLAGKRVERWIDGRDRWCAVSSARTTLSTTFCCAAP